MDHIGMDVHKKESQICILAEAGELIECRVRTSTGRIKALFSALPFSPAPRPSRRRCYSTDEAPVKGNADTGRASGCKALRGCAEGVAAPARRQSAAERAIRRGGRLAPELRDAGRGEGGPEYNGVGMLPEGRWR